MVPGWDVCASEEDETKDLPFSWVCIKVDRVRQLPVPAALFLSLRVGVL